MTFHSFHNMIINNYPQFWKNDHYVTSVFNPTKSLECQMVVSNFGIDFLEVVITMFNTKTSISVEVELSLQVGKSSFVSFPAKVEFSPLKSSNTFKIPLIISTKPEATLTCHLTHDD